MGKRLQVTFRFIACAWLLLLASLPAHTQDDIQWTTESKSAYHLISELRIEDGLKIIRLQSITHPTNHIWAYLEDYAYFLRLFVNEDLKEIPSFLEKSMERLDRVSLSPETNPMSLMCQSQILLHQGALRLQQGQYVAAATDINKAFRLLRKNQKLHPDDLASLRLLAGLKVIYGAIPDDYKWLISLISSLNGTIKEGMNELHLIIERSNPLNNIYHAETVLLTAFLETRFNNKPAKGKELVYQYFGKVPGNRLIQYVMASVYIAESENDNAIRTLAVQAGAASSERIPFLDFMMGKCKLYRGDADADIYFKNFLLFHKGTHFIKEAYQKLAWYQLLKGDRDSYFDHMQQIKIKGEDKADGDQQAQKEAETREVPHPELLRSRLFFDGGYYEKTGSILNENLYKTLTHRAHRLEYLYRKGRLLHAQNSYAEALHYYNLTIRGGETEPYYYACSAAYYSGLIHENLGSEGAAERYYLICLQINPDTYATSLHQKARTGLSRMGR